MKKLSFALCIIISSIILTSTVMADDLRLYYSDVNDEAITVFVDNPGEYSGVKCQIGQEYAIDPVAEVGNQVQIETYILIDNSNSIQERYRPILLQTAKNIIYAAGENEKITVATYDTEIRYLAEYSSDKASLVNAVDGIQFISQQANIETVLHWLYYRIDTSNSSAFKRIILMGDGVDEVPSEFSQEEISNMVRNHGYPVYTLGCTFENNAEAMQNLFRFSRETDAQYFIMDQIQNADQVSSAIIQDFHVAKVTAGIPNSVKDGSVKGVKVSFETPMGERSASFTQSMPFIEIVETIPETTVYAEPETTTADVEPETTTEEKETAFLDGIFDKLGLDEFFENMGLGSLLDNKWIIIVGFIVLILIIVLVILLIVRVVSNRKKNTVNFNSMDDDYDDETVASDYMSRNSYEDDDETVATASLHYSGSNRDYAGYQNRYDDEKTEFINDEKTEFIDDEKTEFIDSETVGFYGSTRIKLYDINDPSQVKERPLGTSLTVGSEAGKADIVFDQQKKQAVSRKHCEIYKSGSQIFIKDLNSTNGTFVDGERILEDHELMDGATIKLGRLELKVEISNGARSWSGR